MAVIIVMMVAATVIEKIEGTPVAFRLVYHNPLFIALWAVAAISGILYFFRRGVHGFFTSALHVSFLVILAGALVTFLAGRKGQILLPLGESVNVYYSSGHEESASGAADGSSLAQASIDQKSSSMRTLPFSLTLKDFSVETYAGSMAASDYRSVVETSDGATMDISMNHIGRHKGYRFYQANYGRDMKTSVLAVSYDPWGTTITYAGYILLLVAMLGFFFQKNSQFRTTLRRLSALSILLLAPTFAQASDELPPAPPKDVADEFGNLYVYYNDRIAPFQTMARDYCLKAYGKAHWKDYSAEQVVTGWLFYYDWWQGVPFKLKAKDKGTMKEKEKEAIRMSAASGRAFRLYPIELSDSAMATNPALQKIMWFACDDALPADLSFEHWMFVRKSLDLIHDEVKNENWDEVKRIVGKIKTYQEKTAASVLPSDQKIRAERFYNKISRPMVPFMASITIGIILFILTGIAISRGRQMPKRLGAILAIVSGLLVLYLFIVLALRWYISGHLPMAGSYSVMMMIALLASILMTIFWKKFPLVQPLGFLLAGFTMLVASLASANPQITHLMPVLQSPLLSIHVLSMMISYTLLGLVALNGIMGLIVPNRPTSTFSESTSAPLEPASTLANPSEKLRDVSLVILYPAVFLLTFGTFLGAVWANVSWGSYWAWDPKETWALITLLVYAATLHSGSLKAFRRPRFFHLYCVLAFITVLITYFGVNLILGGMHSYA